MDVVTHAMSGLVLAAPLAPHAPVTAGCFALGSVLPDLDSLSRLFGKTAFLRWHQTHTHSLIAPLLVGLATWPILAALGLGETWAPVAAGLGVLLHIGLDLTNTYGLTLLGPFSRKRTSLEWVFFIDAATATVSAGCLAAALAEFALTGTAGPWPAVVCGGFLLVWFPLRWLLRRRAWSLRPEGTVSLLPSAVIPWRYFGLAESRGTARLYELDALSGRVDPGGEERILDDRYAEALGTLPEYRIMREISPGYHVVSAEESADGTTVSCRDLRTRNFGGRFGRLEVTLDRDERAVGKKFHV
jgi:inner membrane protein